jgi:NAD(P)-dependent dehydrogenase (short-subunit alcohol dehydrogenase family)
MRFKDKIVIVTGAASGIGFSTAQQFASEGAIVALNDVRTDAVRDAVTKIGGNSFGIPGDVSDMDQVFANVQHVMNRHGRIDVLVNNAGVFSIEPAETVSVESWKRTNAINLDGVFYWAQAVAVQSMIPNRSGAIVNVASGAGLTAIPNSIAYVASKHAVVGVTKALAVEWGRHNIRVNAVCPGLTETDMVREAAAANPARFAERRKRIPIGHGASADDQANAILFLASAEASSISGLAMIIDGGTLAMSAGVTLDT